LENVFCRFPFPSDFTHLRPAFLGLTFSDRVPDAKMIWFFADDLTSKG